MSRFDPCTLRLPLPALAVRFMREVMPGTVTPPDVIVLPIPALPVPTILPTELLIRGPMLPSTVFTVIPPGTLLRLPPVAMLLDIPGIDPPIAFDPLLKAGLAPIFRPPLFVTPVCPCGIWKK